MMFQFLKKSGQRNNNYTPSYPSPYQSQPYQQPNYMQPNTNQYDLNMIHTEINELKREINDSYQRINRLESFLGVRDNNQPNSNFS